MLFCQCVCSWGIVFDICFFCLWYVMLILASIHLILSWFCDFALNTLDSELVLWFCLEYTWFWVGFVILPWIHLILSQFCACAWYIKMLGIVFDISFIVSGITKISCFNLTALAKFAAKMCHVWQGVVVAILQQKCSNNASCYACHDTYNKELYLLNTVALYPSLFWLTPEEKRTQRWALCIMMHLHICNTLPLDNPKIHLHTALLYITMEAHLGSQN